MYHALRMRTRACTLNFELYYKPHPSQVHFGHVFHRECRLRTMLPVLTVLLLLLAPWAHGDDGCTFFIPSGNSAPGSVQCLSYDLSMIAALGGTITNGSDASGSLMMYDLNICANVRQQGVPPVCANEIPAVSYQYDNSSCLSIGDVNASFVYPLDLANGSAGVRIAYNNGEPGSSAEWPRAVIFDFECDPKAGVGKPLSVVEFPAYTYTVRWPSAFACPVPTSAPSCPLQQFDGTWSTTRFRPIPKWFDESKFGIFIHWGIFSVPAFMNEWYWKRLMDGTPAYVEFHNRNYGCSGVKPDKFPCTGPNFTFPEFAPMFKAEMFDPDMWAQLFKSAGAKYVVLTSKHHEGWCNFPNSYHWNWNSVDVGPKRDLVGDLTASVRAAGLHMGLYHSLREWYHPLYLRDNADNCSTRAFPEEVLLPTLKEMVMQYKPEVIWADGAGDAKCTHDSVKYWKSPEFLSWLYNDSPVKMTVLANSRWGTPAIGDYQTGGDRFTPGHLLPYKWESCYTIQKKSWGYDRTENVDNFWNATYLLHQLASSVSTGGNLLLNVGPTADGRIVPAFQDRLLEMGAWLKLNGEAIYGSVPWRAQNDTSSTWYTASKDGNSVYAISFMAPTPGMEVVLGEPRATASTTVMLLGHEEMLQFSSGPGGKGISIKFPPITLGTFKHAWTYKLSFIL